jgi:hypothetical protein
VTPQDLLLAVRFHAANALAVEEQLETGHAANALAYFAALDEQLSAGDLLPAPWNRASPGPCSCHCHRRASS